MRQCTVLGNTCEIYSLSTVPCRKASPPRDPSPNSVEPTVRRNSLSFRCGTADSVTSQNSSHFGFEPGPGQAGAPPHLRTCPVSNIRRRFRGFTLHLSLTRSRNRHSKFDYSPKHTAPYGSRTLRLPLSRLRALRSGRYECGEAECSSECGYGDWTLVTAARPRAGHVTLWLSCAWRGADGDSTRGWSLGWRYVWAEARQTSMGSFDMFGGTDGRHA